MLRLTAIALAAAMLVSGCTQEADSQQAKPAKSGAAGHLVELAPVVVGALRMTSVYTGSLRHHTSVRIFSQEEGRVTRLPYYEGDAVRAGDIILELDGTLLEAELRKAVAMRREAEANLQRLTRLVERRVASEDELLRGQTTLEVAKAEESTLKTRLGYTRVQAPFNGIITERMVESGDIVNRHAHVLTVVDPSSLITELEVSELLVPHISPGDKVSVRIDALGNIDFRGVVRRVHPVLNPVTRQGVVEVELKPVPDHAQAGQFVRVTFSTEALNRMVAPFAALRRDREGEFVFRVNELKAERVAVRSGRRLADQVEMLDGVEPGDQVVIRGFLGLSAGKRVTPIDVLEPAAPTQTERVTGSG
jgi:membrane fusion protein (multidrug efflux system)